MITGRGPGAPGVTPGLDFTRRRATVGGTGGGAVDLGEIRRSEEAINVLAARGAAGPELSHDPALALLGALVADVDTPAPRPAWRSRAGRPPRRPGSAGWPPRGAERAAAWHALAGAPSRGAAAWLRAAVAGGVVAGLASVTSLIATSMLARLARGPARGRPVAASGPPGRAGCAEQPGAGPSRRRAIPAADPSRLVMSRSHPRKVS